MVRRMKKMLVLLAVLALSTVLLTTAAMATETTFDTENFKGLVLTTAVGADEVSVKLYSGFNNEAANEVTPVYTEETADGGMAYYYAVTAGGKYRCVSRSPSGNARYIIHRSIYMSAEEAATKTVTDVTPAKRSTSGWDPALVYTYTDEVLSGPYNADQSQWPDYADVFTTPSFKAGRNPHMQTTQTEMMNFIKGLNDDNDNMYVYILGKGNGKTDYEKSFDIPLVIFTTVDLSGAATWEEAAALVKADSEKTGKVMVHYQAHIHGSEPASGEGALAMIQRFDREYGEKLLEKMNIYVMPRLNPYGAYKSTRNTYYNGGSDTDPNGDFLRLRMVETQLRQKAVNLFDPDVALDGHEYMINMEWVSMQHKDVMMASHFLPCHTEDFQQQDKNIAAAAQSKLAENGLSYGWYTDVVNNAGGGVGSGNAAYRGILHILMETHGIQGGRNYYARRVMGQVSVVTGVLDYVYENAATVRSVVRAQKQTIVDEGKTYEESDQVILEYEKEKVAALAIPGNKIDLASGKLTATSFPANVWQKVVRSRTAPTAYVIPAGEEWTQGVLDLMDKHAITYTFIPAGSGIELQQYTQVAVNDSGRIIEAGLTAEQGFSFPQGAYVFSMAQVNANILSLIMEPDVTQTTTNTLVQSGKVPVVDGMIPIYRYIHDLNSDGSIDYKPMPAAPAGLETVHVTVAGGTGKITGLAADKLYEYRSEGNTEYTAIAAGSTEIADLPVGKYYVRFAETAESLVSADVICEIGYGILAEYTVYLKQSAANDTGDGYTEVTAVKTIATAYAQLAKLMTSAPAGTTGKIVLLDTYTLPKGRQDFPAHEFPVEITGKEATNGFSYPGGGASDANIVAFNGPTTISNLKLTLGGSSTYNYLSAMGHKFVVGQGVSGVQNSGGAYFNINGGDYRGTFASTDVTVLSGSWRQIYAGNYASGTINGDVKLKICNANVTHIIQGTYGCTINGDVAMDLENITGGTTIYGGATKSGKTNGDITIRLGENVGHTKLYAGGGGSTMGKSLTVVADGVDLTTMAIYGRSGTSDGTTKYLPATLILNSGELADVADTFIAREDATIILGCDQAKTAVINLSCNLDLAGHNATITVADGKTVTVCDTTDGELGVLAATGATAPAEGYEEIAVTGGKSYQRKNLMLSAVSLRPSVAGMYYTGTFRLNEQAQAQVECYGVVLSLNADPKLGKEGCAYSQLTEWAPDGTAYGTILTGIMTKDGGYSANKRNANTMVYGVSYIKYKDGTVEYSDSGCYTLRQMTEASDTMWDTLTDIQKQGLLDMYSDFSNVMMSWNIPNIKAAQ